MTESLFTKNVLSYIFLYLLDMIAFDFAMVSRFIQLDYGFGLARALKCIIHRKIKAAAFFR